MEAVVRYARAHGPEFSARDIVPFLRDENIDLMVKENRASTAVSNLIYHSGDKRFSLLKQGLFRFNEAESVEPGKRGRR